MTEEQFLKQLDDLRAQVKAPYLPPLEDMDAQELPGHAAGATSKVYTLVLDLDETLICCEQKLAAKNASQIAQRIMMNKGRLPEDMTASELPNPDDLRDFDYIDIKPRVKLRPGLKEFMLETSKYYEIVIFTAGLQEVSISNPLTVYSFSTLTSA